MMVLNLLKALATPLTVGLFLVSGISGIALFFHVGESSFHEMHEWLSMLLLVPVGLHLWRNWAALQGYLKRGRLLVPVGLCLAIAAGFAAPGLTGSGEGGNPAFAAVDLLLRQPLSVVAPVVRVSPDQLAAELRAKGYTVASGEATLLQIALASRREPPRIVSDLVALASASPGS